MPPIVQGLLDLAKTLHLATVAEGIEHQTQLDALHDQHCDYGQGFLFAKPLNPDDAETFLNQHRTAQPTPVGAH